MLQHLMAQDPGIQSLEFWLGLFPRPRPLHDLWERDAWFKRVVQMLEQLEATHPGFTKVHPVFAHRPDECRYVIEQSFWSTTFAGGTNAPNYKSWVLNTDASYAYRYHRKVLSLIANGDSRRWMLKDPSHIFTNETLLEVYPDACIIQTHREPVEAVASVIDLIWLRRHPHEPDLTPVELGKEMIKFWGDGLDNMESVRRKHNPDQFVDVHVPLRSTRMSFGDRKSVV